MKKSSFVFFSIILFVVGIFAANPLNSVSQIFRSETPKNCVGEKICVGSDEQVIFGLYALDGIGRLTSIFCGKPNDKDNVDYIFLDDILDGITCDKTQYSLDFKSKNTRTNITIRDKVIIKITQGPLHTLDP